MTTGVILTVFLLLWIPFKIIPAVYTHGSNFVASTLSSFLASSSTAGTQKNSNPDVNQNISAQSQKNYYGKPDLQVTLVSTGIMDPATKQFIQTNYAGYNDEIAMKFEVKNIGTNVSSAWKFRVNAPSRTNPYYDSEYQTSIEPGDKAVYTTSFNSPFSTGINTAYVTVDPLNEILEYSENNNFLAVPIKVDGTYYAYNNNYNYGNNIAVPNVPYESLYTWTNINVYCYASPQTTYVGSPVTWSATASGGNGYYTYLWGGSDLLNANTNTINKIYYSSGTKIATITVTSNGQSVTARCSADIHY